MPGQLQLCLSQRIANELRLQSVNVSPSGVRGVLLRHHELETCYKRLPWMEAAAREQTHVLLSDEPVRLLERGSPKFYMRHVEASARGELLNQRTCY